MQSFWPQVIVMLLSSILAGFINFGTAILSSMGEMGEISKKAFNIALIGASVSVAKDIVAYLSKSPWAMNNPQRVDVTVTEKKNA